MTDELDRLSKALLNDPFNEMTRKAYAEQLHSAGQLTESLQQWRLLLQQNPQNSEYQRAIQTLEAALSPDAEPHAQDPTEDTGSDTPPNEAEHSALDHRGRQHLRLVQGEQPQFTDTRNVISLGSHATVRFADIAGMELIKKTIRRRIIDPFINPGLFQKFKKKSGGGVLLYGPPGCGKTMMAKAIATECKASFHAVGISDILDMFIGQSESNLASIFDRARADTPAVLFFDELDALAYSRSKANSDYTRTLVNEFLSQLDGVENANDKVLILGATNMPWDVDDAMKRPGRFDRQIFVPPPDQLARAQMLQIKLADVPCGTIDADKISQLTPLFSGADIDGLIEQAKDHVLDDIIDSNRERNLTEADLIQAVEHITPSTTDWLQTARNLVKFGNAGGSYKDVERFLRSVKMY